MKGDIKMTYITQSTGVVLPSSTQKSPSVSKHNSNTALDNAVGLQSKAVFIPEVSEMNRSTEQVPGTPNPNIKDENLVTSALNLELNQDATSSSMDHFLVGLTFAVDGVGSCLEGCSACDCDC
tara:strand:- start:1740 stop:2108 length:369 start_codon:yes stop_codon:yes gene_type:complete